MITKKTIIRYLPVIALLLLGICIRLGIFVHPHNEGDEIIYQALIEQIDSGAGYTLQGHHILESLLSDYPNYDSPLFFHPPGGIILFYVFYKLFGLGGLCIAQIFCFLIFYTGMILLAKEIFKPCDGICLFLVGLLSSFTPIIAHINTKIWIDNPKIAFITLGCALLVRGFSKNIYWMKIIASALIGYSCFVKIDACLIYPVIFIVTWFLFFEKSKRIEFIKSMITVSSFGIFFITVWLLWNYYETKNLFSIGAPGKPGIELLQNNAFVYYVTMIRSPLSYFGNLITVMPTTLVIFILSISIAKHSGIKAVKPEIAGGLCVLFVVLTYVCLGFLGYSRLLRYIVIVTPVLILLFVDVVHKMFFSEESPEYFKERWLFSRSGSLILIYVAVIIEVFYGSKILFIDYNAAAIGTLF